MLYQEEEGHLTHTISVTRLQLCPMLLKLFPQKPTEGVSSRIGVCVVHSTYQLLSKPRTHN